MLQALLEVLEVEVEAVLLALELELDQVLWPLMLEVLLALVLELEVPMSLILGDVLE